jgi:hypothetical protein
MIILPKSNEVSYPSYLGSNIVQSYALALGELGSIEEFSTS